MTKRELKYWALLKWRYIYQKGYDYYGLIDNYPQLVDFEAGCSYCEEYDQECDNCELYYDEVSCGDVGHEYGQWYYYYRTKEHSKAVLDLIKSIKVDRSELFFRSK